MLDTMRLRSPFILRSRGVSPDDYLAAIWGSSSGDYMAPEFASAMALAGARTYDGGQPGEWSDQIFARLGSRPVVLSFPSDTIPASGSALVTATNWDGGDDRLLSYTGYCGGVHGTLSWSAGDGSLSFSRTTPGASVALGAASAMTPDIGPQYLAAVTLLWAGKNNITSGDPTARVIQHTDDAVAYLSPTSPHVLILGHFVNSGASGTQKTNIATVNAAHASTYGTQFVDVQAWLMSAQVWTDTGIAPTGADTTAQAAGELPPSLGRDYQHLNDATEIALVRKVIMPRLESLWGIGLPVDDAVLWYEAGNPDTSLRRDNLVTGVDFGTYGAKASPAGYDQYYGNGSVASPTLTSAMETASFTAFWVMRLYSGDSYHGSGPRIISTFTGANGCTIRADQNTVDMYIDTAASDGGLTHTLGFGVWGLFVARMDDAGNTCSVRCLTTSETSNFAVGGTRTPDLTNGWRIGNNVETGRLDLAHASVFSRALTDGEISTVAAEIRRRIALTGIVA